MKTIKHESLSASELFIVELIRKAPKVFLWPEDQNGVHVADVVLKLGTRSAWTTSDRLPVFRPAVGAIIDKLEKRWGAIETYEIKPEVPQGAVATHAEILKVLKRLKLSKRLVSDKDLFDNGGMLPDDGYYFPVDRHAGKIYLVCRSRFAQTSQK